MAVVRMDSPNSKVSVHVFHCSHCGPPAPHGNRLQAGDWGSYRVLHDSSLFMSESEGGGVSVYVREAVTIVAGNCFNTFWRFPSLCHVGVSRSLCGCVLGSCVGVYQGVVWVCIRELCGCVSGSCVGVSQGVVWVCLRELCGCVSGSCVGVSQGVVWCILENFVGVS